MALKYKLRQVINEIAELVRKIYTVDGPVSDIDSVVSRMGGRVIEKAHELGHLFLHMDFMTDSDKLRKQSKEVYYRAVNRGIELGYLE